MTRNIDMHLINFTSSYESDYFAKLFSIEFSSNVYAPQPKKNKPIAAWSVVSRKPWELDVKDHTIMETNSSWFEQTKESETLSGIRTMQRLDIKIPDYSDVMDYLILYPDILDLLLDACSSAKKEFQRQAQLSLEVFKDPESDDKYLTLYVRQEQYDTNILERIENISEKYYESLGGKRGWFIINTDFSFP